MKKITTYTIALLLTLFGCAEFTEIEPKGKNLLGTVADLDQLLNYRYAGGTLAINEFSVLVNDLYPQLENIPNMISAPVKTLNSILLTWDDTEDRAALTQMDYSYEGFYSIIGKVANPVLLMADAAEGDRDLANRLKAEAYVLRAYFHYLLVNIFAKAYDPATAAMDGGIPYAKENDPTLGAEPQVHRPEGLRLYPRRSASGARPERAAQRAGQPDAGGESLRVRRGSEGAHVDARLPRRGNGRR